MRYLFSFFLLFLCAIPAIAQDGKGDPVEITADQALEWDREAMTFTARGNAKVVQGETLLTANTLVADYDDQGDSMAVRKITASGGRPTINTDTETLTADKAVAFFSDDESGQLDHISATGNVIIKTDGETLKGNKADYYPNDEKAIVTGNVTIERGPNMLSGEKATFNMKTNTSTMEAPESGRVRAVFYPKSKD